MGNISVVYFFILWKDLSFDVKSFRLKLPLDVKTADFMCMFTSLFCAFNRVCLRAVKCLLLCLRAVKYSK